MKVKLLRLDSIFVCFSIVTFMLNDLFAIESLSYIDEFVGLICIVGVGILFIPRIIFGNHNRIHILKLIVCMVLMVITGLLGNYYFPIQSDFKVALIDVFLFLKKYMIFIFMLMIMTEDKANEIYNILLPLSKCMITILSMLAIINKIHDIGFTGAIGEFAFLSHFGGTVSCWIIIFLAIIMCDSSKTRFFFYIAGSIVIFLSDSGLGILGAGLIVMMYFFVEKNQKIKWYYVVMIMCIGYFISRDTINQYLLDPTAPRALLLHYSIVTAEIFSPIGAGFATFGSATAVTHYSKLYYQYGFNQLYGMTKKEPLFLMDSYYPVVIGQMGYLGIIFLVLFIIVLMRYYIFKIKVAQIRCYALYLILCLAIAGLGFGTGGPWGCSVYIILVVIMYLDKKNIYNSIGLEDVDININKH